MVLIFGFLVRTSSFPEIIRNTHRGKDTERDLFVLEKVWCTKAKSFEPDRKIICVWNRIHFFVNLGIDREEAFFFENPCSEHLPLYHGVNLEAKFTSFETNIWAWYVIQTDFQLTHQKFTTHPNQHLPHRKNSPGQF